MNFFALWIFPCFCCFEQANRKVSCRNTRFVVVVVAEDVSVNKKEKPKEVLKADILKWVFTHGSTDTITDW